MDSLRIILIVAGLSILAGLYIWDRHKKQTKNLRYGKWRRDYRMSQPQENTQDAPDDDDEDDYFPLDDTEEDYDDFDESDEVEDERIEPTISQQGLFVPDDDKTQDALDAMQDAMRDDDVDELNQEPLMASPAELPPAEQIIAFNILADSRNDSLHFYGPKLVEQFSAHGLTFGPMNIYHYKHNDLPVFSIANIVEPGIFDHDSMDAFETPGLVIFMQLPNAIDATQAFDRMLDTARSLASSLDGELRDDARSVLTRQAISRIKEIIAEFALKQQRSG